MGNVGARTKLLVAAGVAAIALGLTTGAEACALTGKGTSCKGSLSAMTILVTDKNWQAKWNTSVDTVPAFHTTSKLRAGQKATLLTFFVSEKGGPLELSCDLAIKETGDEMQKHPAQLCFKGDVVAGNIYLTGMSVGVETDGEPGKAEFTVGIKNARGGGRLVMKTSVEYLP